MRFTYCLIRAADLNDDKQVTLSEIQGDVQNEVPRFTWRKTNTDMRIANKKMNYRIW